MKEKLKVTMTVRNGLFVYDFWGFNQVHYLGYIVHGSTYFSWAAVHAENGKLKEKGQKAFLNQFKLKEIDVEFSWTDSTDTVTDEETFAKYLADSGSEAGKVILSKIYYVRIARTLGDLLGILREDLEQERITPQDYLRSVERLLNESKTALGLKG